MLIARQPIFKTNLDVYGYELLFRSGSQSNVFDGTSASSATASVLGGLFESGIDQIVDDKRAFINFDGELIKADVIELIGCNRLVVEVLEDVEVDDCLIERIKDLKNKGYKVALDDFVESYDAYPLVPYADIIKYDLMLTPLESIRACVNKALSQNKILLAEKVETETVFLQAKAMGFTLFQGYFFSKPSIVGKPNSKSTTKAQYGRIISELKKEEPSYQVLAEIIENDVNLAYRLMRVISTRSGDDLIYSIKRALTYMGLKEIERWINILMIQEMSGNKPKELMMLSLIRTKFAEAIANLGNFKKIKYEASMMGLFSAVDAMLDQKMVDALADISLPIAVKESLIQHEGILMPVLKLIYAYEKGDFEVVNQIASTFEMDENALNVAYFESIQWAQQTIKMMTLAC